MLVQRMESTWPVRFGPEDLDRSGRPDGEGPVPTLTLRIVGLVVAEIRRGRLRAGTRLPSTRELARMLEVNRNTVVSAYDELASEGWIARRPAAGTFVSARLPELSPRRLAAASVPRRGVPLAVGFPLAPGPAGASDGLMPPVPAGGLALLGGVPDLSLVPVAALARAYRRAVVRGAATNLGYADGRGHPRLRVAVAAMLAATRGLAADADDVMITRGSQMALDLLARALLRPGDEIAVEELGYPRAWDAFRRAGARLVPVPVDQEGLDVAALARVLERRKRIRALYATPHHQYPSTAVLSAARRIALLDLARRKRLAIIEDDYDHEFHHDGRPVMPLAAADSAGVVAYVGTFSKVLAPGLRLGFAVAPRPLLNQLAVLREVVDRQGDLATECAVAELIEDGELQRHTRRMRRIYHARRDAFVTLLRQHLGDVLSFVVPPGGMSLWARVLGHELDPEAWCSAAAAHGVGFVTARSYVLPEDARALRTWGRHLRLGYGRYDAAQLAEAVRRMALAARATARRAR